MPATLQLPDLDDVPMPPDMTQKEKADLYQRQLAEVNTIMAGHGVGVAAAAGAPGGAPPTAVHQRVPVAAGPRPQFPRRKTKTYAEIVHERTSIKLEVYYNTKDLCDQSDLAKIRDGILEYQKKWARDLSNDDADMPTVDAMVMGGGAVRLAVASQSAAEQMRREVPRIEPAHAQKGSYQVWGPASKPFHAYTLKMLGNHTEQDLQDTPFWLQRFNPALRGGLIRFNEVVKMRQPIPGINIVRLLVEEGLTNVIDNKGGHMNGLGGPWYLEKRRTDEPLENEVQPAVIEMTAEGAGAGAEAGSGSGSGAGSNVGTTETTTQAQAGDGGEEVGMDCNNGRH